MSLICLSSSTYSMALAVSFVAIMNIAWRKNGFFLILLYCGSCSTSALQRHRPGLGVFLGVGANLSYQTVVPVPSIAVMFF